MSVARCHCTMATGQRGTNWGGSLLIGLVATGAGMQRKPARWRWMAEPRLQRSPLTAPRHPIWLFFGKVMQGRRHSHTWLISSTNGCLLFLYDLAVKPRDYAATQEQKNKSVHMKQWWLSPIIINC